MNNMIYIFIRKSLIKLVLLFAFLFMLPTLEAQQDPQYTQYMFNTMSVNPAYAGQRDVLSITGLFRAQWVGISGAPETGTFGLHSPLRNDRLGLGLSIVNDVLGPSSETFVDANLSYTIPVSENGSELSFGIKGGFHQLSTDWSKGVYEDLNDVTFNANINLLSPTIGAGVYLHSDRWYVGVSVPNFINTKHYDDFQESLALERMHYFLIGGYVFNLSNTLKFKPAFLVKAVSGSPIIADVSANFLLYDKFNLGLAYRWDDSVSGILGFQITEGLYMGYAYDLTTTALNNYNSGSHEIMLRFELQQVGRLLSPRFF